MFKKLTAALAVLALASTSEVNAGPLAYGICQTGCNAVAVACYAAAGAVFGTVTGGIAGELFEIRSAFSHVPTFAHRTGDLRRPSK
ncbi:hypothetical protein PI124_g7542 [Phytophthora idaei]|nr:hypothetical protein PI125_g2490 [Phytophthora idaei]KAG3247804.1 hypothetical protein PI124_g7542 [Phytophthora idaei]